MSDRYLDVQEALERRSLEKDEPPSHVTARRQLEAAKIGVWPGAKGIISTQPEAIIFRTVKGVVMTAWSELRDETGGKVAFYCEHGMPAFSPAERE